MTIATLGKHLIQYILQFQRFGQLFSEYHSGYITDLSSVVIYVIFICRLTKK